MIIKKKTNQVLILHNKIRYPKMIQIYKKIKQIMKKKTTVLTLKQILNKTQENQKS